MRRRTPLGHPPVPAPDEAHPHALVVQLVAAAQQQALVEAHEVAHLVDRARQFSVENA